MILSKNIFTIYFQCPCKVYQNHCHKFYRIECDV